jgi:hypothetical protein
VPNQLYQIQIKAYVLWGVRSGEAAPEDYFLLRRAASPHATTENTCDQLYLCKALGLLVGEGTPPLGTLCWLSETPEQPIEHRSEEN